MVAAERVTEFEDGTLVDGEPTGTPEHAVAVRVSGPVRLDQLAAEVAARANVERVALLANGDASQAGKGKKSVVIWTPDVIPFDALVEGAGEHTPDEDWAPDGSSELTLDGSTLDALRRKAAERRRFSDAEIQLALWHLLTAD